MPVNFSLSTRTDKQGDVRIRVVIYVCGVRFETTAGCRITPSKWDAARKRAKKGTSNAKGQPHNVINNHLSHIEEFCTEMESKYFGTGQRPTTTELRKAFVDTFSTRKREDEEIEDKPTIKSVGMRYLSESGASGTWSANTRKKQVTMLNKLNRWAPDLPLCELNEDAVSKFVSWLEKEGNVHTTINKELSVMRTFLRWADSKGYEVPSDYKRVRPYLNTIPREVIFLSVDELHTLYNYEVPPSGTMVELVDINGRRYYKRVDRAGGLRHAKDMFCFCCFTGLRYSDMQALRPSQIQGGQIRIVTIKTGDSLTIPLNNPAKAILSMYKEQSEITGYSFPRMANQVMNRYLKDVCELCGINSPLTQTSMQGGRRVEDTRPKFEHISTHAGRRTFICYALYHGVQAETIMKITGHKNYEAMRPYIAITDTAKRKAVDVFNNLG